MQLENNLGENSHSESLSEASSSGEKGFVDVILNRHSLREGFTDTEVRDDIVMEIIDCGLHAPSSKNAQPWRLHVVRDRLVLNAVASDIVSARNERKFVPQDPRTGKSREELDETVVESAHALREARLGIFIENLGKFTINRTTVAQTDPANLEEALIGVGLEYLGLGACIENMWLAARANGLEGVFMGDPLIAEETIKMRFGMAGDLVGVLALGHTIAEPRSTPQKPDRVVWHS